jgi:signal transduction histidine kinase
MESIVRRGSLTVAGIAWATALVLGVGFLGDGAAQLLSDLVFPAVAIGAGTFVVLAAFRSQRASRVAWLLLGLGVVLLGIGEAAWSVYEIVLDLEPPTPGWPDVFYLSAYPILIGGVLAIPRLAPNAYQWGQQIVDLLVVVSGLAMLAWMTVLSPIFSQGSGSNLSQLLVGSAYPLGDIFLLVIISVVGTRRSLHVRDLSLWCVMAALAVMAVGDFLYLIELPSGTYLSGTWLDATWLVSYGLFAFSAHRLTMPVEVRREREGRLPMWHALVPVVVVMSISGLHLYRRVAAGESITIELILTVLGFLVLGRLLLIVAEDRRLVEDDRKTLISIVSHELRTPLTAVHGYLDIALGDWDGLADDDKRQMIVIAQEQARLVTRIVTDLVETSRDKLHSTKLRLELVDVGDLLRQLIGRLEGGSRFQVHLESDCLVAADRGRMTQILTNLFSNAERYGQGGEIAAVVRHVGAVIEISIHDAGPGVPRQHRERIWEAFERGNHRFDASIPGSGLGLAIVRSLVDAHGGTVGYRESEVLGGACFWVRLAGIPAEILNRAPVPAPVLSLS